MSGLIFWSSVCALEVLFWGMLGHDLFSWPFERKDKIAMAALHFIGFQLIAVALLNKSLWLDVWVILLCLEGAIFYLTPIILLVRGALYIYGETIVHHMISG